MLIVYRAQAKKKQKKKCCSNMAFDRRTFRQRSSAADFRGSE